MGKRNVANDPGKVYVQDLIWDHRAALAPLILEKRAYVYICGDAKSMAKAVEDRLVHLLAEAKGGKPEVEGAKELKLLKDRNVSVHASPRVMCIDCPAIDDRRLELDASPRYIIACMGFDHAPRRHGRIIYP